MYIAYTILILLIFELRLGASNSFKGKSNSVSVLWYVLLLVKFFYVLNTSHVPLSQGFKKLRVTKITLAWKNCFDSKQICWNRSGILKVWNLKLYCYQVIIITKKHKNQFHNLFRRRKNCFCHENMNRLSKRIVKHLGKVHIRYDTHI